MGAPLKRFPRVNSERVFVATVCLLSLNIVSLFQSSLATIFIKPIYYKNIESLQQFADTKQKILIKYPAMLTDLFPEDSADIYRVLHDRMVLEQNPDLTAHNITNMGKASVTRKVQAKMLQDESQFFMIPECPRNYNLAFLLSKHSIYLEAINKIILDINQFGFINKWIDDINFKFKLESLIRNPNVSFNARSFSLKDMQLHFFTLILGGGLSLVIFFIERLV